MQSIKNILTRRHFLKQVTPFAGALFIPGLASGLLRTEEKGGLATRGVVVSVDDLKTLNWPKLAKQADLTTIGTHINPEQVAAFIRTEQGQSFLEDCRKYNIQIEHELHAMGDLLPRNLFEKNPDMFRMNEQGERVKDHNCCPHSKEALEIISENAVKYAKVLTPTTMRFFYWIDDGAPMCHCNQCKNFSDSDQALIIENTMIRALKQEYPGATLAHLAYANTLTPPVVIKPEPGIFLEFAPYYRRWDRSLNDKSAGMTLPKKGNGDFFTHGQTIESLYANLAIFPVETAQVLEYWLDVALQSKYKKPARKILWHPDICKTDVDIYRNAGIKNITTFAVYVDGAYKKQYGDLGFINEYGKILKTERRS